MGSECVAIGLYWDALLADAASIRPDASKTVGGKTAVADAIIRTDASSVGHGQCLSR